MNKLKGLSLLMLCFLMLACSDDDPGTTCETEGLTYSNAISSIFNTNCALSGCHANGTTTTSALSTHAQIISAPIFNNIVGAINHQSGFSTMPQGKVKLDQCTIDKITSWIDDGAPL